MIANGRSVVPVEATPLRRGGVRLDTVLQSALTLTLTWCVILMAFYVLPGLRRLDDATARRESAVTDQERGSEKARDRYIQQQAEILLQQKRTQEIMDANAKLADELHRKLKEKP